MPKSKERLRAIFHKTDGSCHLCHKRLSFSNHGKSDAKGGWHIEHSTPKAKGGTDHLNNLFAACISCNIEKGVLHTKTIRRRKGVTRAPISKSKRVQMQDEERKEQNAFGGFLVGGSLGLAAGGPIGGAVGAIIGGVLGLNS